MQRKILVFAILAGLAIFLGANASKPTIAHAQSAGPQFMITWQASNSYAPAGYTGKVLPNDESHITASVEVLSQGQPVDLSNQTIYWYLDDNFLGGDIGAQRVTFKPFGSAPTTMTLKVELPDYPGGFLIHEINIPLAAPQAVIETPYPANEFTGTSVTATALPYFFNVTSSAELNFAWMVNGETVSSVENPQTLEVSLPASTPAGYGVGISLTVTNPSDSAQATANTTLTYEKSL